MRGLADVSFQLPIDHLIRPSGPSTPDVEAEVIVISGIIKGLAGVGSGYPKLPVLIDLIGMNGGNDLDPLRAEAELCGYQLPGFVLAHNMGIPVIASTAGQQAFVEVLAHVGTAALTWLPFQLSVELGLESCQLFLVFRAAAPDRLSDQLCHRHRSGLQMLRDVETDQGPAALAAVIKTALTVHTRSVGAVAAEDGAAGTTRGEVGRQHHLLLQPRQRCIAYKKFLPERKG